MVRCAIPIRCAISLLLHSSFLQLHDLLIACVSPGSSSQARFLHMGWFGRTPFFEGNNLFALLVLTWLWRLTGCLDFPPSSAPEAAGALQSGF